MDKKIIVCLLLWHVHTFCMLNCLEEFIVPSDPIPAFSAYDEEVYFSDLNGCQKKTEEWFEIFDRHLQTLHKEIERCKTIEDEKKHKQLLDYCFFYKNKLYALLDVSNEEKIHYG
jgi:hypothetical protein